MIWTSEDARLIQTQYALWHSNPESVFGWWNREAQEDYADDLLALCGLRHARILDLGCGDGILFERAQLFGFDWDHYTGVDTNEKFLNVAQQKFAGFKKRVEFVRGDALSFNLPPTSPVDFVIASGLFAVRPLRWSEAQFNDLIFQFVQHYAGLAKRGVIFNVCPRHFAAENDLDSAAYSQTIPHFADCRALVERCEAAAFSVRLLPQEEHHLTEQFPLLVVAATS